MAFANTLAIESFAEYGRALAATFLIPTVFLVVDYILRYQVSVATADELMTQAGPDCCILSFGALGSVFIDPHIRATPGLSSPITSLLLFAILLVLRFMCLGASKKTRPEDSLRLGLIALLTVLLVPTVAFVAERLK